MKNQTPKPLTPEQLQSLHTLREKVNETLEYINIILKNPSVDAIYTRILDRIIWRVDDMQVFANFVKTWNNNK